MERKYRWRLSHKFKIRHPRLGAVHFEHQDQNWEGEKRGERREGGERKGEWDSYFRTVGRKKTKTFLFNLETKKKKKKTYRMRATRKHPSLTSPWTGNLHKTNEEHNPQDTFYGSVWGPGTFSVITILGF